MSKRKHLHFALASAFPNDRIEVNPNLVLPGTSLALKSVAIRDCEARAGNGGAGGSGANASPAGNGGNGGAARGGAILALGQPTLANSNVQQSFARAGAGGDGGTGGNGGIFSTEGNGGGGGNAGLARGGAVFVDTGGALLFGSSATGLNKSRR